MRICVCGLGKVGRPMLEMFTYMGFAAVGYDSDSSRTDCKNVADAVEASDCCIFIVQTPSLPNGSFCANTLTAAVTSFSNQAKLQSKRDYLYIVSSTTTPGTCDSLRLLTGGTLVYKPEFIRLEYVRRDFLNPSLVLIGQSSELAGDQCAEIYKAITDKPVYRLSLLEAELAKITLNCALTMKISLANQLHLVAKKYGCDSSKIMECVGADPRIGTLYLKPGEPYGGPCLPRDNRMFRYVAERVGVNAALSRAADEINEAMK